MFDKKIASIVFLIFFSLVSFAQLKGRAFYVKSSSHDFSSTNVSRGNEMNKLYKSVNGNIENMEFVLKFNDSLASYREIKKLDADESDTALRISKIFSGYSGPYYYELKNLKVIRKNGEYLVESLLTDFEWVLSKDKLVINNLTCYKATTTLKLQGRKGEILRPVVAWYTTDINISAGPDGFGGLPGLIIQVETNNVVTTLRKIQFSNDRIDVEKPDKGKKITEKEYNSIMKELVENRRKNYNKN